jgi:Flp pilus assembly protein TadD
MVTEKSKTFRRHLLASGLIVAASLLVAGCEGKSARLDSDDALTTGSTAPVSLKETAELGGRWQKKPGDMRLGLAYASRLKALGQADQQLMVLKTLSERNPGDHGLKVMYGKQLAEAGKSAQAAGVLQEAIAAGSNDWKTYSALGSVLDQQAKYAEARTNYEQALKLSPNQITVLNNLGMSYALEGNLAKAEATLRTANELPAGKTEPRIRQNLALVIGLQGRFDEARQIASQDLPANEVEANMAYLQKMLSQPDTWKQLQQPSSG